MYVHDEKKLCFLASPRTGSRSWRDALMKVGFRRVGGHHSGPFHEGFSVEGYETFCVVRNHWDAILSWWFYRDGYRSEPRPSVDWMARHFVVNSHISAGRLWYHSPHCDHIIRYETMLKDYANLMEIWGFDNPPLLGHVGRSIERKRRVYQDFYDHETRQFVAWAFLPEIFALGYQFDVHFSAR